MITGPLGKMRPTYQAGSPISYQLPLAEDLLPLNSYIGKRIDLHFLGEVHCIHCGRKGKKSFGDGFCYPCFKKLPQADLCQVRPETCHFHQGTCRISEWGRSHCFVTHTVYLANSSGIKVGITRRHQQVTRWMDQGAHAALPILEVNNRKDAGLVEQALMAYVPDKTNWRTMLKGLIAPVDLEAKRDQLYEHLPAGIEHLKVLTKELRFNYPVLAYPQAVKTFNLDKSPQCTGTLVGIKGQYLLLDTGVLNVRKFSGYRVRFSAAD